jgi:hypothetical protein
MPRQARATDKPATKIYTFVLPVALIERFDQIASEERRSRVKMLEAVLADYVRDWEAEHPPARKRRTA